MAMNNNQPISLGSLMAVTRNQFNSGVIGGAAVPTAFLSTLQNLNEIKSLVAAPVEDATKEYMQMRTLAKLIKVEHSPKLVYAHRRRQSMQVQRTYYDRVPDQIVLQRAAQSYSSVFEQLSTNMEIATIGINEFDAKWQQITEAKDPTQFLQSLSKQFLDALMYIDSRTLSRRALAALYVIAGLPSRHTGLSTDYTSQDYVATGKILNPVAGLTTNVFNPAFLEGTTPPVGTTTDILLSPAKFFALIRLLTIRTGVNRQAGGTLYLHQNARFVIEKAKADPAFTNLFNKSDYTPALGTSNMLSDYSGRSGQVMTMDNCQIRIEYLDDMGNANNQFGVGGVPTWYHLNGNIDTRNIVGIFLQGEMPLVNIRSFEHEKVIQLPMGEGLTFAEMNEYYDPMTDARGNLTVINSQFQMSTQDFMATHSGTY